MRVSQRTINLPSLLIAGILLVLAALHHPIEPGPRFSEILEARDLLVAYHVDSPSSDQLMKAAWEGARKEATKRNADLSRTAIPGAVPDTGFEQALFHLLVADPNSGIPRGELAEAAISAMAASLNDLHTSYLKSAEWKLAGGQSGPRRFMPQFLYRSIRVPEGALVWDVSPGSEAMRGGLHVKDTITAINGHSLSTGGTINFEIRESNRFTVLRPNIGKVDLTIKVEPEAMHPFEAHMVGDIAYFRIYAFPPLEWHLDADFFRIRLDDAMKSLAAEHPLGWVVDLRGNHGGYADTVAIIAGALGVRARSSEHITTSRERRANDKNEARQVIYATGPSLVEGLPVAVLTDRATVSAAEILAFDLQESGARVFGTITRGSVRGAARFPLQRGGGLSISVDTVKVGIRGVDLERVGVIPDEDVPFDPELARQGRDSQLERALYWLEQAAMPAATPLSR